MKNIYDWIIGRNPLLKKIHRKSIKMEKFSENS